jgi:hypothetical protein
VIDVPVLQSQDEVKKANKEKDRALMKVGVRKGMGALCLICIGLTWRSDECDDGRAGCAHEQQPKAAASKGNSKLRNI